MQKQLHRRLTFLSKALRHSHQQGVSNNMLETYLADEKLVIPMIWITIAILSIFYQVRFARFAWT